MSMVHAATFVLFFFLSNLKIYTFAELVSISTCTQPKLLLSYNNNPYVEIVTHKVLGFYSLTEKD
jgi:hypothetical protein